MTVPDSMTEAIASKFYDKEFSILSTETVTDSDGFTHMDDSTVTSTFKGNINFTVSDAIQQQYGISEEIDATISTQEDVSENTIIEYDSHKFKVFRALKRDSHYLLLVRKWLSKSSTWISA